MWVILLVAAATFGLCFLVDKLYTRFARNSAQHRSGKSIRQNKRYATIGLVLSVIAVAAMIVSGVKNTALIIGSVILLLVGIGLIVYYMSTGIYYDETGFLVETLGKKRRQYRYGQIRHQLLYVMQGGGTIVELHMEDGTAVQVVSNMTEYDKFLYYAFQQWCAEKGLDPENCQFHDPANSLWFPDKEDAECTSQL